MSRWVAAKVQYMQNIDIFLVITYLHLKKYYLFYILFSVQSSYALIKTL